MSTIQDFYTMAQTVDFARLHQFRLLAWSWNGQPILTPGQMSHSLYMETATLPGRENVNVPVPFMGLNFNLPGLATYSGSANFPVVFRADSSYFLRQVMEHYSRKVFNDATGTGDYNMPSTASIMTLATVDKYLYTGNATGDNITPMYTLHGVSMLNTGQIDYNLGDTGQIAKVNATLTYHYWTKGTLNDAQANTHPSGGGEYAGQVTRDAWGAAGSQEGGGAVGGQSVQ